MAQFENNQVQEWIGKFEINLEEMNVKEHKNFLTNLKAGRIPRQIIKILGKHNNGSKYYSAKVQMQTYKNKKTGENNYYMKPFFKNSKLTIPKEIGKVEITDKQKEYLLQGDTILVKDCMSRDETKKVGNTFVQVDKDTNRLFFMNENQVKNLEKMKTIKGCPLNNQNKKELLEGKRITLETETYVKDKGKKEKIVFSVGIEPISGTIRFKTPKKQAELRKTYKEKYKQQLNEIKNTNKKPKLSPTTQRAIEKTSQEKNQEKRNKNVHTKTI